MVGVEKDVWDTHRLLHRMKGMRKSRVRRVENDVMCYTHALFEDVG